MTQLRYLVLIFSGLCIALSARPVFAQDDDPTVEMARQRFKEGIDFFDAKQFQKARAAFLQAYALKKHPAVLLNLAQSELRSGHEADAADHFSEYLRTAKEPKAEERQAATTGLSDAKRMVAEVSVSVDEPDADVLVDGKVRATSPLPGPIYLVPGSHTLTARKAGKEVTSTINVEAGDSSSTKLSLKLHPESEDVLAGGADDRAGAAKATRQTKPEPEPSSQNVGRWFAAHPVAWLTTGLAVGGIGGGIGFSVASKSSYAHADDTALLIENEAKKDMEPPTGICTRIGDISARRGPARANDYKHACDIYKDNVNNGDAMKIASIVGFSLGGAAAVGTVIYYVVDTSHGDESEATANSWMPVQHVTVSPSVGASYTGLSVSGSF